MSYMLIYLIHQIINFIIRILRNLLVRSLSITFASFNTILKIVAYLLKSIPLTEFNCKLIQLFLLFGLGWSFPFLKHLFRLLVEISLKIPTFLLFNDKVTYDHAAQAPSSTPYFTKSDRHVPLAHICNLLELLELHDPPHEPFAHSMANS